MGNYFYSGTRWGYFEVTTWQRAPHHKFCC